MFITFEGIDGAGKTTLSKMTLEHLRDRGFDAVYYREPGGTSLAEEIREKLLRGHIDPLVELFLFEASRASLVRERIIPDLDGGKIVILDRFTDSTLAYQGYGRGIERKVVKDLNDIASCGIRPDITFLIDLDPEIALGRLEKRDRFEEKDFLKKVREGFLDIARQEKDRFRVLDGRKTPEELLGIILRELEMKLEFV